MKRLFTFAAVAAAALCLISCSVPLKKTSARKNGLDCSFTANTSIELDKLQAEGVVNRRGSGLWDVEFTSPNSLSGVKLEFAEGNVSASYKGLSFSVPQSAIPVKSMMLNLMKAVDENASLEELKGEEKDGVLRVEGKLDGGDYALSVDGDGRLAGFEMANNKLKMSFTGLTVLPDASPVPTTESASETETVPAA